MEILIGLITVETVTTLTLLLITIILLSAVAIGVRRIKDAAANDWARFSPSVMGKWADYQKRKFRWLGMRWEIEYETPFISLGAMDDVDGLVEGPDIYFINGTKSNLRDVNVDETDAESEKPVMPRKISPRMLAPRDERASWVKLLATVQLMERDSASWETQKWRLDYSQVYPIHGDVVSLAVGIQHLRRVYRPVLPAHPTKPYAAITIAHLVGLAALLSMNWKEFNQVADIYLAQGNGFLLRGRRSYIGLVFTFERTGPCHFQETRVIPTTEINELCFGHVPTLYRDNNPVADKEWQTIYKQRELKTLQLGSSRDIANTLRLIGCNAATIHYYFEGGRTAHIFPGKRSRHNIPFIMTLLTDFLAVIFEVIGMLGRNLHISDRYFTYLPNPTIFSFDKRNFSFGRLLRGFVAQMDVLGSEQPFAVHRIRDVANFSCRSCRSKLGSAIPWNS